MSDIYQLAIAVMAFVVAPAMVVILIWMRSLQAAQQNLGEMFRRMNDSQADITRTQQIISQGQKELTAILQLLVTQVSVMEARQEGWRPNE